MPAAAAPTAVVADDERLMREQIVASLKQAWPELLVVGEASNGNEAVAMVQSMEPDIVFLDISMPGMNGIEALQRLRADPATRAIPVIAVTASAMTQDRRQIMAAGFDGYQSKPISVKGFLQAVREMLPS